jgi:hypothetical protein
MKANLTKYAFIVQTNCPMWPNHCVMVEHPLGEYVKFEDAVVGSSDIAQQLKAEIAAIVQSYDDLSNSANLAKWCRDNVQKMRQLSAV